MNKHRLSRLKSILNEKENAPSFNGNTDKKSFDAKLEFDIKLLPYKGDDSWVEGIIFDAIECLKSDTMPQSGDDCDFCKYRDAVTHYEKW